MPCSRTDAPLAEWPPRLKGESNTGSCRIQTPFCTTASIAQPTEQCVHTVRLTSILPLVISSLASAAPIMLNGSCEATAPAPTATPERLRKARRSSVFTGMADSPRARRAEATASPVALRVSSMSSSSDLGGAVVVVDVRAGLVAARRTLVLRFGGRNRRGTLGDDGRRCGDTTGARCKQEVTSRKLLRALVHLSPL